jgi:hypothetical protein
MHIYSHGNNKEYLTHIVAVLRIIKQRGLDSKCRKLKKAVLRQSEVLKNLLEAAGSQDTVLMTIDVTACKVEIEQTQQLLQDFQKAHDKAIAKVYEQLQNLLSGNLQAQWDRVCHEMHKHDLWARMNGQVTKGGVCKCGCPSKTVLSYISSQSSVLMQPQGSGSTFSKRCTSPRGPLCDRIFHKWEC